MIPYWLIFKLFPAFFYYDERVCAELPYMIIFSY